VQRFGMMLLAGITAFALIGTLSFIFWHLIALFD
jgi:hypothetical protein